MTHLVIALSHSQSAASTSGTGTYWFAIGLLAGLATAWFTPLWVKILVIVFDFVALGWAAVILHMRWLTIAAVFLVIGMFVGVPNGLRYLGEAEFRTRLGNIRKNGRWI